MSIRVPLDELDGALAAYPWCYLVSVGDDQRAHSLAVPTRFADGRFHAAAGRSTRANVAARPGVTLVFPPSSGQEYSLIIDGEAQVQGEAVEVVPTAAVLHRPALGT
jgi:hypothetical protein